MERKIRQVIAEYGVAPKPVLDPESAVEPGVVLLGQLPGRTRCEKRNRPVKRLQLRFGHVTVVVPHQPTIQGREVHGCHYAKEKKYNTKSRQEKGACGSAAAIRP